MWHGPAQIEARAERISPSAQRRSRESRCDRARRLQKVGRYTKSGDEFTKGLRPTSITYPDGRIVHATYGSSGGADDKTNRLAAINADSSGSPGSALASYQYLGAGTPVIEDYEEPDDKTKNKTKGSGLNGINIFVTLGLASIKAAC